jgi:hypothetical protein
MANSAMTASSFERTAGGGFGAAELAVAVSSSAERARSHREAQGRQGENGRGKTGIVVLSHARNEIRR